MNSRVMTRLIAALYLLALFCPSAAGQQLSEEPDHSFLHNRCGSIALVDTFALMTTDYGLMVGAIDSATLRVSGRFHLNLPTRPLSLKAAGSVAAVLGEGSVIYFIDISSLPTLTLLGEADPGTSFLDYALNDQSLYLACEFSGVRRYAMTAYQNPVFADSSQLGVHCVQVEVDGSRLYVLDDYNGVIRYDVGGGEFGAYDTTLWLPRRAYNFSISGSELFVPLLAYSEMYVAEFDPTPQITETIQLLGLAEAVFAADNRVAVLLTDQSLEVRDRLTLSDPMVWLTLEDSVSPAGAVWNEDSELVLLAKASGGLTGVELDEIWNNYEPVESYDRPGPIRALNIIDGRVHTGGLRNPYEVYSVDSGMTATLDTSYQFLTKVVSAASIEGHVALAQESPNLIRLIDFSNDSISNVSASLLGDSPPENLQTYKLVPSDTLAGMFVVVDSNVRVYRVSQGGTMQARGVCRLLNRVRDYTVLDSLLIASDASRQIYGFRLYDDYTVEPRWTITAPEIIDHLRGLDPYERTSGDTVTGRVVAFSDQALYEIDLTAEGVPEVRSLGWMSFGVRASAQSSDWLYVTGNHSTGILDLTDSLPVFLATSGFGGYTMALQDSILGVTDGNSILLYRVDEHDDAPPTLDDDQALVAASGLYNYPNPFNPRTNIAYSLASDSRVALIVLNTLGQKVATLVDEHQGPGPHQVEWDGTTDAGERVSSGVYFYRLETKDATETRKMMLIK